MPNFRIGRARDLVKVSASAGNQTSTLPTGAAMGTKRTIKKTDATINKVTIATAGSDVLDSTTGSLILYYQNEARTVEVTSVDGSGNATWTVVGDHTPVAGLDSRYASFLLLAGAGIDPTGTTDSTAAIQAKLNAAGGAEIRIPRGTYLVSSTLLFPAASSVSADSGATIKANATITGPVVQWGVLMGTLAAGTRVRNKTFKGSLVIECNNLADTGMAVYSFLNIRISDVIVQNSNSHKFIYGDPTNEGSNELHAFRTKGDRSSSGAVPAGSYGIWVRSNTNDSVFHGCVDVGAETSFRAEGGSNTFDRCHGWGWAGRFPTTVFDDVSGGNDWINCYADTPTTYGFRLRLNFSRIIGGAVTLNSQSADNVVVGVHFDQAAPNALLNGLSFIGASSTNRIATEYDGVSSQSPFLRIIPAAHTNVAVPKIDYNHDGASASQFLSFGTTAAGSTTTATFGVSDSPLSTNQPGRTYTVMLVARDTVTLNRSVARLTVLVQSESTTTTSMVAIESMLAAAGALSSGSGGATHGVTVSGAGNIVITIKNNGTNTAQYSLKLIA